ncbi:MAG: glutamine synthetase [Clostridiaceae bacterium]
MNKDWVYYLNKEQHSERSISEILKKHPEIKFVSFVGIDLSGNDTDEKIPINNFLKDIEGFLNGAVQTDGSSVVLPGIATLNNAKVDMIPDKDVNWYIDYNLENIDKETNIPIGTLRIPCFLIHEGQEVDSRHVLKRAIECYSNTLIDLFRKYPESLKPYNITIDEIDKVIATSATELEFWVKTPNDIAKVEQLSTSQTLKEQYWTRTKGAVRTALEESLIVMDYYGLGSEMGHKEVGGVKAKIDTSGNLEHVMEQLEIDWKYSNALQTADNELLVRNIVKETFRKYGLEVTFKAKPIEGVAGSGEHTHVGMALKLKTGKVINLFTATRKHFLSQIGYASVMGVLKNYEVINPFVSATNDSLRRLKPGFEAPVCIVTSLGHTVEVPSRNRTVLMGLVRDEKNPLATRFELRSPNPFSNTFLVLATLYMTMLDGVKYAITNNKNDDALLKELSKVPGEDADYLDKNRAYRSEEDVFEDFTDEERISMFGKAPATVYENLSGFDTYIEKTKVLTFNDVFTKNLIESFKIGVTERWTTEVSNRILTRYIKEIRNFKPVHCPENSLDLDIANWMKVNELRYLLVKDSYDKKSLFTLVTDAANTKNYKEVSKLQVEIDNKMNLLRDLYSIYRRNLLV